ncbi:metallophosphoesterase [Natronorubrum daqingense]|uniref:Phosphoesterase n=1 Tax=Natronorubrum daqingense TaxID=588898 RepID=A0A1N7FJL7_9EURY|nr:metallophosphoesterase [Natronorubrum daqingense]APX98329.1 phosphoesterase [Natronorubrum daqingense]SIS00562.1 putative phosphoesterase [Natronorubrum daqingense]
MSDESRRSTVARVEPVPDEPVAIATVGDERALLVADYHAGYEAGLRSERGVTVPSRATERRERLLTLLERTDPDRLVALGDLMHSIGDPGGAERGELEVLLESVPRTIPVTVVKGNHDGAIETWLTEDEAEIETSVTVVPGAGIDLGAGTVGVCHGHTWPTPATLECDVLCLGHEHPCVRLEDDVGGSRVERTWLRGELDPKPFRPRPEYEGLSWLSDGAIDPPRVVVLPAFNDLVGGTWINVPGQSFLSPFLPAGIASGEAYLLDGTRLGPYQSV